MLWSLVGIRGSGCGVRRSSLPSLRVPNPESRTTTLMPIYLPETTVSTVDSLTPRQIVAELDKYVIRQTQAKRAVAVALRNRMRRQKLPPELAEEVAPKNILMIGPTGVGKTEIARRLARLAQSPFIKVEASKFTEVGYVGRDVESMVRDLVELAVDMVREERLVEVREKAQQNAEERLLDLLLPPIQPVGAVGANEDARAAREFAQRTREKFREQLHEGRLDNRAVEVDVREKTFPSFEIVTGSSVEEIDVNIKDMLPGLFQGRTRKRRMKVPEAAAYLVQEEEHKLVDMESVWRAAVERVEQAGIIFIDEIDKIASRRRDGRLRPRSRREPGRRPARHPPDCRGHHRQHQARHGEAPTTFSSSRRGRFTCRSPRI